MRHLLLIAACLASPAAGQEFFTLKGHGGPIMGIAVSPTGQIATASFDNAVGLWSGTTPAWLDAHEAAVNAVAFGLDNAVFSAGDDFTLRRWNGQTRADPETLGRHQAKITHIAVHPDGTKAATASWDATIGLWPLEGGAPQSLKAPSGVNAVAFGPDGDTLYAATATGELLQFDITQDASPRALVKHGFGINEVIVTDAWVAYGAVDGGTRIIDAETGAEIADFTLDRRPILSMAYHAGTRQLAVGDGEGYIMVIDTEARTITRDFRATKQGPIWALAFSPDGQNIHAGGIEDVMYSWPVATMDEHGPMTGPTRSFLEDPATLPNGERQFKRKCSICHTLTEGSARKAGPSLYQLFGRRAGTVADYPYSDTLQNSEIVWSPETINGLFDDGPDHYIPGTKMPMQRIVKRSDRDDLIAYLQTATRGKEN